MVLRRPLARLLLRLEGVVGRLRHGRRDRYTPGLTQTPGFDGQPAWQPVTAAEDTGSSPKTDDAGPKDLISRSVRWRTSASPPSHDRPCVPRRTATKLAVQLAVVAVPRRSSHWA